LKSHKFFEVDFYWTGRAHLKNSSLSVRDSLCEWLTQSETDLASVERKRPMARLIVWLHSQTASLSPTRFSILIWPRGNKSAPFSGAHATRLTRLRETPNIFPFNVMRESHRVGGDAISRHRQPSRQSPLRIMKLVAVYSARSARLMYARIQR